MSDDGHFIDDLAFADDMQPPAPTSKHVRKALNRSLSTPRLLAPERPRVRREVAGVYQIAEQSGHDAAAEAY